MRRHLDPIPRINNKAFEHDIELVAETAQPTASGLGHGKGRVCVEPNGRAKQVVLVVELVVDGRGRSRRGHAALVGSAGPNEADRHQVRLRHRVCGACAYTVTMLPLVENGVGFE